MGAALNLSYRSLSPACQRFFRGLGLIPGPDTDTYAAAALAGTGPASAAGLLESLVDHNLLIQQVPGRYLLHDLVRLHARAMAEQDPVEKRQAAVGRLLAYYQRNADRADWLAARVPRPAPAPAAAHAAVLPDADAAWAWLRTESRNLLAAVQHAADQDDHEYVIAVTASLDTPLRIDGPWARALLLHAAAAAAHSLGDQRGQADALTRLGDVHALACDSLPRLVIWSKHSYCTEPWVSSWVRPTPWPFSETYGG